MEFFRDKFLLEQISAKGDSLERLNATIPWKVSVLSHNEKRENKSKSGRPHWDYM
ncbi:hypothetical protein [Lactococcus termiticola]|uniref:Uncharacterized protein n=1 Tax=Lactococcus termiticola TaxID=2169526 RepID=A0A2R5HKT9_9LACT|nr:hypothetical protein [Lactococcus termiticola]GBG97558.1 hypothetical protein NtB2_01710 [Lactococcus termiticola]